MCPAISTGRPPRLAAKTDMPAVVHKRLRADQQAGSSPARFIGALGGRLCWYGEQHAQQSAAGPDHEERGQCCRQADTAATRRL